MRRSRKFLVGTTSLLLVCLAALGWVERHRVLAWYYVQRLAGAGSTQRDTWVRKTVEQGTAAVAPLAGCFGHTSAACRDNARICACQMVKTWGAHDGRTRGLLGVLAAGFSQYGLDGQQAVLDVARFCAQQEAECPAALALLLERAAEADAGTVRLRALTLAETALARSPGLEVIDACRALARHYLADDEMEVRTRAMRLALQPRIDLLQELLATLRDSSAEIRRTAMLVVGPMPEAIATDDLLYWLHDPDAEVRRLCEGVLRGRGLQDHHLKMGRLITDNRPAVRTQVLDYIRQNTELEPGAWLRRLSHDSSAAVRAATLRFAREDAAVDLSDRIEQMAHDDPSATVRQLARYYLALRKAD